MILANASEQIHAIGIIAVMIHGERCIHLGRKGRKSAKIEREMKMKEKRRN